MKIQFNIRAGAGQKRNSSTETQPAEAVSVPVVPVNRCTGYLIV